MVIYSQTFIICDKFNTTFLVQVYHQLTLYFFEKTHQYQHHKKCKLMLWCWRFKAEGKWIYFSKFTGGIPSKCRNMITTSDSTALL